MGGPALRQLTARVLDSLAAVPPARVSRGRPPLWLVWCPRRPLASLPSARPQHSHPLTLHCNKCRIG